MIARLKLNRCESLNFQPTHNSQQCDSDMLSRQLQNLTFDETMVSGIVQYWLCAGQYRGPERPVADGCLEVGGVRTSLC